MPGAHRHDDLRACLARTVVTNQSTVFVNGKLWAVEDDENDHGHGELIPTKTSVRISGKPVIVHTPDEAKSDDAGHSPLSTKTYEGSTNVMAY